MLETLVQLIQKELKNEFFTGGFALILITGTLAALRHVPQLVLHFLQRRFITVVDVADHDPAFFWIQKWLGKIDYTKKSRLLTVSTRQRPALEDLKKENIEVIFNPAPGSHFFWHQGNPVLLRRNRSSSAFMGDLAYHEDFTLYALSRTVIQDIIREAQKEVLPPEEKRIAIYRPNWNGWQLVQHRKPRDLHTVLLHGTAAQDTLEDLQWFTQNENWYAHLGIPYQRGYLLHGKPGNGKTSLVVALASTLRRDIYLLNPASVTDQQLNHLMALVPEHSFLLIEDVDCVCSLGERKIQGDQLTFSGFLNAIDGVCAPQGRILFMSTNYPDNLDPALVRPGRIDRKLEFLNASQEQAKALFLHIFQNATPQLAQTFAQTIPNGRYSMAELQEHLLQHRDNPEKAAQSYNRAKLRSNGKEDMPRA